MLIQFNEMDYDTIRDEVQGDFLAHLALVNYGLLMYFEYAFLHSQEEIVLFSILMWIPNHQSFEVQGNMLDISTKVDIYFLTGLPN
jgi:hypothetical protein